MVITEEVGSYWFIRISSQMNPVKVIGNKKIIQIDEEKSQAN